MTLNYLSLTVDELDGQGNFLDGGGATFTPSVQLTDAADHELVTKAPLSVAFKSTASPVIKLLATDNAAVLPAGWAWTVTFGGASGNPASFNFSLQAGPVAFTATSASPCVFTATAPTGQPWVNGMTVTLSGTVPAGFTAGTTYYLTGVSGSTFSLAATLGGAAIASTSTGSGNITVTGAYLSQISPVASAVTQFPLNPMTTAGDMIIGAASPAGTPARLAAGASGQVLTVDSGTGLPAWKASAGSLPLTTLGDILFENATPAPARLPGNTTAAKQFLTQTGTGSASAAPAWGAIAAADVPTLNQSTTGNAATATNLAGGATLPAYVAPKVVTLTDGASVALNAALGNDFRWTLGASSHTLAVPSNPVDGQSITIAIKYGGAFTPLFSSVFDFGASGQPAWSAALGKTDYAGFRYDSALNAGAGSWAYMGSVLGLTS